jgi:cytochrome c oxidase cbb3-type subunit III
MRKLLIGMSLCLALAGCKREERDVRGQPPVQEGRAAIAMSTNSPGDGEPVTTVTQSARQYEGNAYHISEGQRLYRWFNCSGCHANGGGGMGPALMDDKWFYGSSIENIAATIREGRPNGMPSFRGKIPDQQIFELAAYVRSLSGNQPQSATPVRSDHMNPIPQMLKPDGGQETGSEAGSAAEQPR